MPSFHDTATSSAPPEEVWKLLYDPSRFPDWWAGIETVDVTSDGEYTLYPEGYPDFPMAQLLDTHRDQQRVTVSCLVSDLRFEWRLEPHGERHADQRRRRDPRRRGATGSTPSAGDHQRLSQSDSRNSQRWSNSLKAACPVARSRESTRE